jgi:hypothetical protein
VSNELIDRLEALVGRLLHERGELLRRNRELLAEREALLTDCVRVHAELGELLAKIDQLETESL